MKWNRSPLRRVVRPSRLAAIVAVGGIALAGVAHERHSREAHREAERHAVLDRAAVIGAEIERLVGGDLRLARSYAAMLAVDPGMPPERMRALAGQMLQGAGEIRALAVAPGGLVSMVEPIEGNAALLGRALGAAEGGLAGPLETPDGRRVLMARAPVRIVGGEAPGRTWGLVALEIDAEAALGAVADPSRRIAVALVDAEAGDAVVAGDAAVLAAEPVTVPVPLPSRGWTLAAAPPDGWSPPPGLWRDRVLFALAALLLALPILGTGPLLRLRRRQRALIGAREAELSRLSWRLEFALATSQIGVWDADLETDRLIWDDRAKALFGFASDKPDLLGTEWEKALHPEDRGRVMAAVDEVVAHGGRFEAEYRILLPDGALRHVRDMASVYVAADGARHLVGLIWDVSNDVARSEELNLRRLEAEAATVAKSRFLAAMSHEIRTPLGGVLGLLGLMLGETLPPRQRERAAIALGSARSLLEILNDILDFSKLEAAQIRVCDESVAIRELVHDVAALMAAGAAEKRLALTAEVAPEVPARILVDPMRLRQVLTNLVSNATKFTDRGEIGLRVGWDGEGGGTLRVEVVDTGIGIEAEQCERIFQHFVQADSTLTRRAGGTGLGLAISRQLVELMGGAISVRSVPGIGSSFTFTLRALPAEPAAQPAALAYPAREAALRPLRVLLAEDHSTNQYLIRAYLRSGKHVVTVAENGAEAVEAVRSGVFDVVLMDMQMPVIDGLEATRRIRALGGAAADLPIIALTANAMPEDRAACFEAGMSDYLSKPVEATALLAALRRACGGAAEPEVLRSAAGA